MGGAYTCAPHTPNFRLLPAKGRIGGTQGSKKHTGLSLRQNCRVEVVGAVEDVTCVASVDSVWARSQVFAVERRLPQPLWQWNACVEASPQKVRVISSYFRQLTTSFGRTCAFANPVKDYSDDHDRNSRLKSHSNIDRIERSNYRFAQAICSDKSRDDHH